MIVKGFPLIKFQSAERINDLQNGLIYMNSLEWFRKHESKNGDIVVGDSFEAMFHLNEGKFVLPDTGEEIEIKNELIQTTWSNDYAYCMFGINPYSNSFRSTDEQKQNIESFGDTALLILDKDEFLSRIRKAAQKEEYELYEGFVRYYDETQDSLNLIMSLLTGMQNIAFWKRKKYYYQQEFRLLVHAQNCEKEHIEINIGDIRDISKVLETSKLLNAEVVRIKDNN